MASTSRSTTLTAPECRMKAEEARRLAMRVAKEHQRVMLQHVVETWLNLAHEIEAE